MDRHGIKVAGISADGDWRLLNGMLHHTNLNTIGGDSSSIPTIQDEIFFLQDIVHILTKMRNRLLKASVLLPLGSKLISVAHLKILINEVEKAETGLVLSDICPDDRQNYRSLEKVMERRVTDSLSKYVVGSHGTIMFINICRSIQMSLYNDSVSPLVRISKIWEATFFLRAWRKWLQDTNEYTIEDNFITRNAYACIELNATNLVQIARSFRNHNMEHLFVPSLFNSQPNEETFRQLRSMGTMNYTKINFTLLELFHLIGRIELQNDIVYVKLSDMNISFPRNKINEMNLNHCELPSDDEIRAEISSAKVIAITNAAKFGIIVHSDEIEKCQLKQTNVFKKRYYNKKKIECDRENREPEHTSEFNRFENSPLIDITLASGAKKTVRKSTLLWTLTESKQKLSSDRLKRVRDAGQDTKPKKRRRLEFKKAVSPNHNVSILSLIRKDELQIGEWSIFQYTKLTETNEPIEVFVTGNILSFKYINGKTEKDKQYSWEFAPVTPDPKCQLKGIEVLASWFEVVPNELFTPIANINSFYINIGKYVTSLVCSTIKLEGESGCLSLSNDQTVSEQILTTLSRIAKE